MSTSVADEISMDGSKPLPPIEELAVMDRLDLVSMLADANKRVSELKFELEHATRDHSQRRNPITARRVEAIRRAREWHGQLRQLAQNALSLIRDAEKAERHELSMERDESQARRFVSAARRVLSDDLYRAVWDEANRDALDSSPARNAQHPKEHG